jgi:bifunctional UDP-N-acetylglucosamine pyrophosphorylase/glucosamine-1-phosphate N-acetyltransferase
MATFAAVVLAAGKGTRFKSQTPKVLHHVCGKEMVRLVVDAARAAGVQSVAAVVPKASQAIRDAFGDTVEFAVQPEPLGSGDALLRARHALEESTTSSSCMETCR